MDFKAIEKKVKEEANWGYRVIGIDKKGIVREDTGLETFGEAFDFMQREIEYRKRLGLTYKIYYQGNEVKEEK